MDFIHQIKSILESIGTNDLWLASALLNANAFRQSIFRPLLDQNIQKPAIAAMHGPHNLVLFGDYVRFGSIR